MEEIMGAKNIERRLRRSFINLVCLNNAYDFPLKKTGGVPSVNMREVEEWVKEWGDGLPLEKITSNVLAARKRRLNILSMPVIKLSSIQEIVEFTGCSQDMVLNWIKCCSNCPIKKDQGAGKENEFYFVDAKDLLLWMNDMGIRR